MADAKSIISGERKATENPVGSTRLPPRESCRTRRRNAVPGGERLYFRSTPDMISRISHTEAASSSR